MKFLTVLALTCFAGMANAQEADWSYRSTLYLWFPGMSASVETPDGTIDGDLSASDALSNLDMGFMGTFAAQHGNWVLWTDLLYTDLGASEATPHGILWDEARVEQKLTALTAYALYDVNPEPAVQVALGAGARYFDFSMTTSLSGGSTARIKNQTNESWIVPVLAAQVYAPLNDHWFLDGFADWGSAGGGTETWQIYAGAGYKFNEQWSTQLGYRYMDFSKEIEGNDVQTGLSGVVAGVTFAF